MGTGPLNWALTRRARLPSEQVGAGGNVTWDGPGVAAPQPAGAAWGGPGDSRHTPTGVFLRFRGGQGLGWGAPKAPASQVADGQSSSTPSLHVISEVLAVKDIAAV